MRTGLRLWALTAALAAALTTHRQGPALTAHGRGALLCRHTRCRYLGSAGRQHKYEVDGFQIRITHYLDELLKVDCKEHSVLESEALPRAERALRVPHVVLARCPLPTATSLAAVLAALRVTLQLDCDASHAEHCGYLELDWLPPAPPLAATHFLGVECLELGIFGPWIPRLTISELGFLTPLRSLRRLKITNVEIFTDELRLMPWVRQLAQGVRIGRLPATAALESLWVDGWEELQPAPLARCDALRTLRLVSPKVTALPSAWLANCPRVADLTIVGANIIQLPQKLLVGASSLTHLIFAGGSLARLPEDLLDHSPDLRELQLNDNRLRTLPNGAFRGVKRLQTLDLSWNELDSGAMAALTSLSGELTELNLKGNPRVGDVCDGEGYSPIRNLTRLRKLLLARTSVSRVCRDWRENMPLLEMLDLSRTSMTALSLEDFQWTRCVQAQVMLWGAPLATVQTSREQFRSAARSLSPDTNVSVTFAAGDDLDQELEDDNRTASEPSRQQLRLTCDCHMYWTRRALELALPALRHVGELLCSDERALRDVPPEELVCARPDVCAAAALPPACACGERPGDDPTRIQWTARVRCEPASLTRMPRLPALPSDQRYELLLPHNNITELRADDLPDHVIGLDLRNNSLRVVDEETAGRLGALGGMVRLAGNPFECSCRAMPLLHALSGRNATLTDVVNTTCRDGRSLHSAFTTKCQQSAMAATPYATWLASALAALLALVLAAAAYLWSRERRFFARAVLHRWGLSWHTADPEKDDGRRYDAFVTFSHKDSAAALELVARLEPPYRLCVHYRDWVPGCFIPAQIVASVHESRRTVALVSRHFLESTWARAEFREAHAAAMLDARPRLVVVLLEEPAALQMDAQLRRYVATHTYLRWGEPWFWDKLAVALPRPRDHAPGGFSV